MDFSNIRIMKLMDAKMAYAAQNQDIIAQNIANANTPGYRAKEIQKVDFEKMAMLESHRLHMMATSPEHKGGAHEHEGPFEAKKQKKTFETTPVKNNVVLEEQTAKLAYNNIDYMTATDLYKKYDNMFKTALGK